MENLGTFILKHSHTRFTSSLPHWAVRTWGHEARPDPRTVDPVIQGPNLWMSVSPTKNNKVTTGWLTNWGFKNSESDCFSKNQRKKKLYIYIYKTHEGFLKKTISVNVSQHNCSTKLCVKPHGFNHPTWFLSMENPWPSQPTSTASNLCSKACLLSGVIGIYIYIHSVYICMISNMLRKKCVYIP